MGVRWLPLLIGILPFPALAETWTGIPKILDGDSLVIGEQEMRLHNIDAFEREQLCTKDGQEYRCGIDAEFALIELVQNRPVTCEGQIRDRYGRVLAKCRIGDLDIGAAMVRAGWALAEWRADYRPDEQYAQAGRYGAWAGTFERPRVWRRNGRPHLPW